jgi:hypothetical protein
MHELVRIFKHSPYVRREQEVEMSLMNVEQHNGRMNVVFFASGSRWGEPRKPLYFTLDTEQLSHLSQRIQTQFGFCAGQPVH